MRLYDLARIQNWNSDLSFATIRIIDVNNKNFIYYVTKSCDNENSHLNIFICYCMPDVTLVKEDMNII